MIEVLIFTILLLLISILLIMIFIIIRKEEDLYSKKLDVDKSKVEAFEQMSNIAALKSILGYMDVFK